ncbi:MAG: phosphotransferase family protein [Acidimicrobiales bacterium]
MTGLPSEEERTNDDARVQAGLALWLADRQDTDQVRLTQWERPSSGFSSDTVFVRASWTTAGQIQEQTLVLRTAPQGPGTFSDYDLSVQCRAQHSAAAAGVPVADPVLETDPSWIGRPFILMRRVDGHLAGGVTLTDPWLVALDEPSRGRVAGGLLDMMARVHQAVPPGPEAVPHRDNEAELDHWDRYLQWSSGGAPVTTLVDALDWCRRHRPDEEPEPALLWGDARLENVVVGDDLAVRAVLDWDMTTVGAPWHDLAWFTSLDTTMEHLFGRRLPGWPDRQATITGYEEAAGCLVTGLDWYETLAIVRSTALMTRIGYLRRDAGEPALLPIDDNPILDQLRARIT